MKKRYDNIDGLRTIACLGIIAMHVLANTSYKLSGWFFDVFVPSWSLFVYLFFIVSGFGMFCGYYDKIRNNEIDLNTFYRKRYVKIVPFFVFLIIIDLLLDFSYEHLIEGMTEPTLVFGLLPNIEFSVIGVGWTLGVIFLFYMLLPFVTFLFWTKKRALFSTLVSIILSVFCSLYFFGPKYVNEYFTPRHNLLYSFPYFAVGGLIFLFREEIQKYARRINKYASLLICFLVTLFYYTFVYLKLRHFPDTLILFTPWFIHSICYESRILSNRITKSISRNSLEYYLSHMVIFRLLEKLGFLYALDNDLLNYISTVTLTVVGLVIFVGCWKKANNSFLSMIRKRGLLHE